MFAPCHHPCRAWAIVSCVQRFAVFNRLFREFDGNGRWRKTLDPSIKFWFPYGPEPLNARTPNCVSQFPLWAALPPEHGARGDCRLGFPLMAWRDRPPRQGWGRAPLSKTPESGGQVTTN